MNPFEYINEMREYLKTEQATTTDKEVPIDVHYNKIHNILDMLEKEITKANFTYTVTNIKGITEDVNGMNLNLMKLTEDVLLFQPVAIGEAELAAIDIQSLASTLKVLRDNGTIDKDMLILPPNVNVFTATLADKDSSIFKRNIDDFEEFEIDEPILG